MSITKKFMLSALAISTALGLVIATPQASQSVNASRCHYSRVYRVYRAHRTHRRTRRISRVRCQRSHRTRRKRRSRYGYIHGHRLYYMNNKSVHRTRRSHRGHYRRHAATQNKRRTRRANHRIIRRRHRAARPSYHQEVINDLKAEGEVPMSTQSEIQAQEQAARKQTLTDINNDRASVGEGPLTETSYLDSLAQERAWQLDHVAFSHTDPNNNGETFVEEDGGSNVDVGGENIDQTGDSTSDGYGPNGKQGANEANNAFFTQEKPNDDNPLGGGHYQNITTPEQHNVGIGVYYNGQDDTGYNVAEDFQ